MFRSTELLNKFAKSMYGQRCGQTSANRVALVLYITVHTKAPLSKYQASSPFSTIHMDLVGPLPTSSGHKYLLTIIDRCTRWFEIIPIVSISTYVVIREFNLHWISRYGVPHDLITDRGTQFSSHMFSNFCRNYGIKHNMTTSYHPQCNGMIERFHRVLKNAFRSLDNANQWYSQLPLILLSLRNSYNTALGTTPAKFLFHTPIRLPNALFKSNFVHSQLYENNEIATYNHKNVKSYVPKALKNASYVWLRQEVKHSSLQRPYSGPYKVLQQHDKYLTINYNGKNQNVIIDRLKPLISCENDKLIKKVRFFDGLE